MLFKNVWKTHRFNGLSFLIPDLHIILIIFNSLVLTFKQNQSERITGLVVMVADLYVHNFKGSQTEGRGIDICY